MAVKSSRCKGRLPTSISPFSRPTLNFSLLTFWHVQAFVDEMVDIAQFKWLAEFNTSKDKRGLIAKVLASLIYTASTLHAAVNFPQRSILSFAPSTPGSVYVKPPTDKVCETRVKNHSYFFVNESCVCVENLASPWGPYELGSGIISLRACVEFNPYITEVLANLSQTAHI